MYLNHIYLSYDYQSSWSGCIDMEFKEILENPESTSLPMLPNELFDAVCNGYYESSNRVPKYMETIFDWSGNLKQSRISKRLVKVWCKNVCKFGLGYLND